MPARDSRPSGKPPCNQKEGSAAHRAVSIQPAPPPVLHHRTTACPWCPALGPPRHELGNGPSPLHGNPWTPLSLPRETRAAGFGPRCNSCFKSLTATVGAHARASKDTPVRAHCRRNPSPVRPCMSCRPPSLSRSLSLLETKQNSAAQQRMATLRRPAVVRDCCGLMRHLRRPFLSASRAIL